MSSAVYLVPENITPLDNWRNFCTRLGYEPVGDFDPGRFYSGGLDGVEITYHQWEQTTIAVSTFWMGDLNAVVNVAKQIAANLPAQISSCAPELHRLMYD